MSLLPMEYPEEFINIARAFSDEYVSASEGIYASFLTTCSASQSKARSITSRESETLDDFCIDVHSSLSPEQFQERIGSEYKGLRVFYVYSEKFVIPRKH